MKKVLVFVLLFATATLMIFMACDREVIVQSSGVSESEDCFVCHGDNDALLLAAKGEWLNSVHASGASVDYTNRAGRDCAACHVHQGFLDYLATGTTNAPYDQASAIHCFTCHAPHTTGNLGLRTTAAVELANGVEFDNGQANICANCHQSRTDVRTIVDGISVGTRFGPHHSVQGDFVEGTGGYEFDGYTYTQTNHKGAVRDACIGCHMAQYPEVHDGYDVGGHSWNMVAEETGSEMGEALCGSCHADVEEYDFLADADYDHDGDIEGYQTEVVGLLDSLAVLLVDAGLLDEDHSIISQDVADANVAGALYNWVAVEEDRSVGIHNYRYIVGLLQSSIEYLD